MGGGGGKKGGGGSAKNYYGSVAGGVCIGKADGLVAVLVNSEECWPRGTAWAVGMAIKAGGLYVFDAQTWWCTVSHTASAANAPDGTDPTPNWTEYCLTIPTDWETTPEHRYTDITLVANDETVYGKMTFHWGTPVQMVDEILRSDGNDLNDQHPDYQGVVYVVIKDFLLGQEVQSAPNIEIIVRRRPEQSIVVGTPATIVDGQANLAAVAAELLTNPNCIGLPADHVDAVSFQAIADYLQANEQMYGASVLIDTSESITSIFDKVIQMFDGCIRFNPETEKIELGIFKHGVVPATYVTLTADSLTKAPKFSTQSWQNAVSRAVVRYDSRQLNYAQTSTQSDDARVFSVLRLVRETSLDRPWITRPWQAVQHGIETLRVMGLAQMKGDLEIRREIGRDIRPGDYVLVDIDLEPNANSIYKFFRVLTHKIPQTGPVTITVSADNALASVVGSIRHRALITPSIPVLPFDVGGGNVRYTEVPYKLSGSSDSITVLARRPELMTDRANLYFDTARLSANALSIVADSTGEFAVITFETAHQFIVGDELDVFGAIPDTFNINLGVASAVDTYTVTYKLKAAVAPSLIADGVFGVVDYNGTFTNIGLLNSFAASGQLGSGIDDSQTSIDVASPPQPDSEYFTVELNHDSAVNDRMLLFVIEPDPAEPSQIAENEGGCVKVEIMSVAEIQIGGLSSYTLKVLRGRQGTTIQSFTSAAEAWLIPKDLLKFFTNAQFATLRTNRWASLKPDRALFRLQPLTSRGFVPLDEIPNQSFRFQGYDCFAGSDGGGGPGWGPTVPGYHTEDIVVSCVGGEVSTRKILVKD